jgi:hypothetical protein
MSCQLCACPLSRPLSRPCPLSLVHSALSSACPFSPSAQQYVSIQPSIQPFSPAVRVHSAPQPVPSALRRVHADDAVHVLSTRRRCACPLNPTTLCMSSQPCPLNPQPQPPCMSSQPQPLCLSSQPLPFYSDLVPDGSALTTLCMSSQPDVAAHVLSAYAAAVHVLSAHGSALTTLCMSSQPDDAARVLSALSPRCACPLSPVHADDAVHVLSALSFGPYRPSTSPW